MRSRGCSTTCAILWEEAAWGRAAQARELGGALDRADDGSWYLTVSTTRPETMLGDTAVAVNPGGRTIRRTDRRARRAPAGRASHPDRRATTSWIANSAPGWSRSRPRTTSTTSRSRAAPGLRCSTSSPGDARLNENVPPAFRGMSREDGRRAVLKALEEAGLLAGSKAAPAHRAPLLSLRHGGRTPLEQAVVRAHETARLSRRSRPPATAW